MIPVLAVPIRHWECPNCTVRDTTQDARPHTRFHACAGLRGLTAPMVPEGSRARIVVHEREDYIGREKVQMFNGRPVMSVVTERPDGSNDALVFAPTATGEHG